MPTLNIEGRRVTVDDSFLKLSPDEQSATVDEIAKSFGAQPAAPQQTAQPSQAYSGSILPFTKDAQGVHFDSNAGIVGMAKRALGMAEGAVTLPGDVYSGKTPVAGPDGNTSPEVISRSADLATMVSPVTPALRAGEGVALVGTKMVKEKPPVPTAQALQDVASQGYSAARNSGLKIKPEAITGKIDQVRAGLEQDGIFDQLAPKTFAIINKASSAPEGGYATVANLEAIRRSLQLAARDFTNPTEQLAASRVIKGVDEFLSGLSETSAMAGPPAATSGMGALASQISAAGSSPQDIAAILTNARGNYAAAQRSNSLTGALDRANTGILERAEARAQAANSGRNLDNTIRQKIVSLLEKPKEVSGFSDQELTALNNAAAGGPVRNSARYVGNFLGGGGGLGQMVGTSIGAGAGAVVGGVPGAIVGAAVPAVAGAGAKTIANILAKRSLRGVDELVRSNSPLYREMLANSPTVAANLEKRAAVARALLLNAMSDSQTQ